MNTSIETMKRTDETGKKNNKRKTNKDTKGQGEQKL